MSLQTPYKPPQTDPCSLQTASKLLQATMNLQKHQFWTAPSLLNHLWSWRQSASRFKIRRPLPTEGWRGVLNFERCFWPTFSSPRPHRHAADPAGPAHFSRSASASILYYFSNPFQTSQSHPKSSKKLPKPSPRPSQNDYKTASHLALPEIFKKYKPPIRNPHF